MYFPNRVVWTIVAVAVLTGVALFALGILEANLITVILGLGAFSLAGLILVGYQPWLRTP
jgi:hypothetical protein